MLARLFITSHPRSSPQIRHRPDCISLRTAAYLFTVGKGFSLSSSNSSICVCKSINSGRLSTHRRRGKGPTGVPPLQLLVETTRQQMSRSLDRVSFNICRRLKRRSGPRERRATWLPVERQGWGSEQGTAPCGRWPVAVLLLTQLKQLKDPCLVSPHALRPCITVFTVPDGWEATNMHLCGTNTQKGDAHAQHSQ